MAETGAAPSRTVQHDLVVALPLTVVGVALIVVGSELWSVGGAILFAVVYTLLTPELRAIPALVSDARPPATVRSIGSLVRQYARRFALAFAGLFAVLTLLVLVLGWDLDSWTSIGFPIAGIGLSWLGHAARVWWHERRTGELAFENETGSFRVPAPAAAP